ncbi:phi PVL ORF 22-like protein [Staphylococcus aureus]|nr:phi PVL ORF 22-like protein [Staphylococcus aureus]
MAKEIINNTERFILVQIDKEGTERVVYQDFTGSFTTSEMVNHAQDFKSEENAKKIAETLNLLYQLTGNQNSVKVVKEVVDRTDLSSDKTVDSETM